MIERARALVGHRLRVYRVNEQMTGNPKMQVRTVVHLTDYSPDTDPVHEHSANRPVWRARCYRPSRTCRCCRWT
ncbi:putative protein OS=Streptomyces fumanus OX=67302 GN=GCM10018772_24950 PE=4 SV=1 [Streptomyces fumanus]|uniref:Uncharacterized protein n=1 Tax=Streptomyces fumanus TaxID=67302 RepID=A0A919ACQ1_9ACTN|nr:hypothetical protein GCM10018772_24950 [Streptomyces fumanus]